MVRAGTRQNHPAHPHPLSSHLQLTPIQGSAVNRTVIRKLQAPLGGDFCVYGHRCRFFLCRRAIRHLRLQSCCAHSSAQPLWVGQTLDKPPEGVCCALEHPSCARGGRKAKTLPILHLSDKLSFQSSRTGLWRDDSGCWAPDKASSALSLRTTFPELELCPYFLAVSLLQFTAPGFPPKLICCW